MTHDFELRVYYEDTDLGGIVYYANYLKFIERGRTEMLRSAGIDQVALKARAGVVFVVRHLEADFRTAARMDDLLTVRTRISDLGRARITMAQDILRHEDTLFSATVTLACLAANGRPTRVPQEIADALN